MDAAERSKFVGAYAKLLSNAWADDAYMQRVRSDPVQALEEVGLSVPSGTKITVSDSKGDGTLDDQIELWEKGISSGDITLYVPEAPKVDTAELSEGELEGVAGGADSYCCCCSPCCTCTA
jgi:hypothetical protein